MKKFLIILTIFFASVSICRAADLSLVAPGSIYQGQTLSVDLDLETDGASINSVDIGIAYPKKLIDFKGYKDEGGVIHVWLKSPTDEAGIIQLSGIIPGGVDGSYDPKKNGMGPLSLVTLLFEAKNNGTAHLAIDHSAVLLNDGQGNMLAHTDNNASVTISENPLTAGKIIEDNKVSQLPPNPFTISFVDRGYFSKTPALLIFSTIDADSGIQMYELSENNGITWTAVTSPALIHKHLFPREVIVRAVDFDSNSRESRITIPGVLSTGTCIFIIMVIAVFAYSRYVWYKKRR